MTETERLKAIRKEDVLAALHRIDEEGIPKKRNSEIYDLVYKGKIYPPKYVLSLAGFFSPNKRFLLSKLFKGGDKSIGNKYLTELGFDLVRKTESVGEPAAEKEDNIHYKYIYHSIEEELIHERFHESFRAYLEHCNNTIWLHELESYKFRFGRWLNSRVNFANQTDGEILEICLESQEQKYQPNGKGVNFILSNRRFQDDFITLNDIKLLRRLHEGELLDENDLKESPLSFPKFAVWAATLFPEKYFTIANEELLIGLEYLFQVDNFPKRGVRNFNLVNTTMKKIVEAIKASYEAEINTLLNKALESDGALKPVDWVWLTQDYMLFLTREYLIKEPNYWLFQGNPDLFDIKTALKENILDNWTVSAHKDSINTRDKVIIWMTGKEAGCYALGEITTSPQENVVTSDNHLWKTEEKRNLKVGIHITHNLLESPILKYQLEGEEAMKDFKGGNQGTNFLATKEQFQTLLNLVGDNNEVNFEETLNYFRPEDLETYFTLLKEIIEKNKIPKGAPQTCFNFTSNSLRLTIGQRIAWFLIGKGRKQMPRFIVHSKDKLNDESKTFDGSNPKPYYTYLDDFNLSPEQLNSIHVGISQEYKRSRLSAYRRHNKEIFENYVYNRILQNMPQPTLPLNIILYGPPGTGKTFCLKNKYFNDYSTKESSLSESQHFEEVVRDLTWWHVIAIALLEEGEIRVSDIVANKWVKTKANMSESKNVRATIWGTLQMHTVQESQYVAYTQRQTPLIFDKNEDKSWKIIHTEVKEQVPELFQIMDEVKNFKPDPDKVIKHYVFCTFHQSFSYEDFIEGIKPKMSETETEGSVSYQIEDGVFKKLCQRADSDPNNHYAIFIDEINRGNVAAIFGELITLIELDKRKGQKNELSTVLPYSKKPFFVPSNVDIIATMNTADRSVEALDTALRRRFSFEEMLPQPHLLYNKGENESGKVGGIDLEELLTTINERIEVLVDRDHTIGHAYFMDVKTPKNLKWVFKNKIIPLLQEYFYGDYAKMEMVLGPYFFERKPVDKVRFATQSIDYIPEGSVYHIRDVDSEDFDLNAAIIRLLNKPKGD